MLGYLALAAVSIAVFIFVLEPLLGGEQEAAVALPAQLADLRARRQYLIEAIRDVDFDHASGKVGDEEYRETRGRFLREAALATRDLNLETGNLDDELEVEILKLRALVAREGQPGQAQGAP